MRLETQREILKHIDRLKADTGGSSHGDVVGAVRQILGPPLTIPGLTARKHEQIAVAQHFFSVILLTTAGMIMPGAEKRDELEKWLDRVDTQEKLESLLRTIDEPKPFERHLIFIALKTGVPVLRRFMLRAAKDLRPDRGGAEELLSDPEEVSKLVDEIFEARKKGESLRSVQERLAIRKNVSLKTMQRRYREEMKRRAADLEQH